MKKLNVVIDTSPLSNGHAMRGIGMYTKLLTQELEKKAELQVFPINHKGEKIVGFQPDVTHFPYFDLFFPTLPLRHSIPTVVTIHDVIPLLFQQYYPVGKKGWLSFYRQKLALNGVSAVITDSEASRRDITKYLGIKPEKIHVVYLAGNPEVKHVTESQVSAVKKEYHLPEQYLLYVGDINYNKNIPQLIKALKFLPPELKLVCVGKNFYDHDIPEWRWIETQVALSDVADRVCFITDLGSEASDQLSALYSGAVAYVQPSLAEGFGLPVLEAMQCRTPVVCAKNSSLVEVGAEHVQFVEPSAESIADGVKYVLDLFGAERQRRGVAAAQWASTFTWSRTATETVKVYQSVVK